MSSKGNNKINRKSVLEKFGRLPGKRGKISQWMKDARKGDIPEDELSIVIEVGSNIRSVGDDLTEMIFDALDDWAEEYFTPSKIFVRHPDHDHIAAGDTNFRVVSSYGDMIRVPVETFEARVAMQNPWYHFDTLPFITDKPPRHILIFYVEGNTSSFSKAIIRSYRCSCGHCPQAEWVTHGFALGIDSH